MIIEILLILIFITLIGVNRNLNKINLSLITIEGSIEDISRKDDEESI